MQRENNNSSLIPHCLILQGLRQYKCRITLDGNLDACSKRPTCDPGIYMLGSVLSNHELGHEYSLGGLFQAMASTGPPRRRHQVRCSLTCSLWFIDTWTYCRGATIPFHSQVGSVRWRQWWTNTLTPNVCANVSAKTTPRKHNSSDTR